MSRLTWALEVFSEHWDKKYPKISQSWRDNWANLTTYFKYPQVVRQLIYTTNAIEGVLLYIAMTNGSWCGAERHRRTAADHRTSSVGFRRMQFYRHLRTVSKAKSVFPTDDSLFKMLYLAMMDITNNEYFCALRTIYSFEVFKNSLLSGTEKQQYSFACP